MSQYVTFQERINRIEARQQFVADGLTYETTPPPPPQDDSESLITVADIVAIVVLFVSGFFTVFFVRLWRHQYYGADHSELTSLHGVTVDAGATFFIALLLFAFVKIRSPMLHATFGLGAMLCYLSMHTMVHYYPELWAQVFSLKWVYLVLQQTDPNAVLELQF